MSFISSTAKKIVFWNYSRTSWQWDVLCVLILVFIFLTPKSWFETTAFRQNNAAVRTVTVAVDVVGNQLDRAEIERRARSRAAQPAAEVVGVREVPNTSGQLVAYEVDIK